jgi:hypothetical protein
MSTTQRLAEIEATIASLQAQISGSDNHWNRKSG